MPEKKLSHEIVYTRSGIATGRSGLDMFTLVFVTPKLRFPEVHILISIACTVVVEAESTLENHSQVWSKYGFLFFRDFLYRVCPVPPYLFLCQCIYRHFPLHCIQAYSRTAEKFVSSTIPRLIKLLVYI